MSSGTAAITITVNATAKRMVQSAYPYSRNLVSLTISGAGVAAGNLALLVFRGSAAVASCSSFAGTTTSATGSMDLNTAGMLTVMEDVAAGAVRSFDMILYDTTSLATVARGVLDVLGMDVYSAVDPSGAVPVASTGLSFEVIDGIGYFLLRDAQGTVYKRFPAPGATPND